MEMYQELKVALGNVAGISEVEMSSNNTLVVKGPYDGCPDSSIRNLIKGIAEKYGMEPEGWGWIYQFERVQEWERNNPAPKDPRYNSETSNMFTPSAKNPKNKAAKEILNKYFADKATWQELKRNECPSDKDPGFTVNFDSLGKAKKVEAFYKGSKYFGD